MDIITLKKKLSVYVTEKGQLRNLSDEMLGEVLAAWECWTGPSAQFYRELGFSYKQLAGLVGKAKRLKREGRFGSGEFKEIKVESVGPAFAGEHAAGPCTGAEVVWDGGRVIHFNDVDLLINFLKRSA